MDTNYIKPDGFSNPDTEAFFKKHWDDQSMKALCASHKHCGMCVHGLGLMQSPQEYLWWACLNEDSPYFLETVHVAFGCAHQEPSEEGEYVPCPWRAVIADSDNDSDRTQGEEEN